MTKLYKRKFLKDNVLYTTSSGKVYDSLISLLNSYYESEDFLCESYELLYEIFSILPHCKVKLINNCNCDFKFYPLPFDTIDDYKITLVIGYFENVEEFHKIHQIGVKINGNYFRFGVEL